MRRTSHAAIGLLATSLLLVATAPGVAAAAPEPDRVTGGWHAEPIDWQPCPERPDDPGVRCATLDLPIDWSRPDGATFPLAIAKRAATGPEPAIGPLLINPGGPGGSGVNAALGAEQQLSAEVLRRFDVIGFDPRGVARSSAVVCSIDVLATGPSPAPATAAGYADLLRFSQRLHEDCRQQTGPLFDHLDTLDVVRDMDAIRAALNARQISYYGLSYGTLIGQTYAERFPDRVRALVIDSNMDHSLGVRDFLLGQTVGAQESFEEFAAWCDRDERCALHGRDVLAVFDELMRRADAGGLVDPGTGMSLDWYTLSGTARTAGYAPDWPSLAEWLATLADTAGDPDGGQRSADRTDADRTPAPRPVPAATLTWPAAAATNNPAATLTWPTAAATNSPTAGRADVVAPPTVVQFPMAILCQDWSLPVRDFAQYSRFLAENRRVAPQIRASTLGVLAVAICLGWSGEVGNPQHRPRVRTDIPLLVLGSRYDPATPYQWSVAVAKQLGRHGRLVSYLGWGHGAYDRTPCTVGFVDRYLVDRIVPPAGASCAPAGDPVSSSAQRRSEVPPTSTVPTWSGPYAATA